MDEPAITRIEIFENACLTMQRKFDMLVKQKVYDSQRIQECEMKIARLETIIKSIIGGSTNGKV